MNVILIADDHSDCSLDCKLASSERPTRSSTRRPIADAASQERVRDLVLHAYAEYEETVTETAS
jgi:hypothetical protein